MRLRLGQFVTVDRDPGVVVGLFGDDPSVPDEHVAIWFGEVHRDGKPLVKTVPEEYAKPLSEVVYYH